MKAIDLSTLMQEGASAEYIIKLLAEEADEEVKHHDEQAATYPHTSRRRKEHNMAAIRATERASAYQLVLSILKMREHYA
jgi:hypothetical protein